MKIAVMNILAAAMQTADALTTITLKAGIENKALFISLENKYHPLPSSASKKEETGIGLSIVRTLIEAHNGVLHFNRSTESCSVLTMSFPVAIYTAD